MADGSDPLPRTTGSNCGWAGLEARGANINCRASVLLQSTERWRDTTNRLGVSETDAKIKRPVEEGRERQRDLGSEREE